MEGLLGVLVIEQAWLSWYGALISRGIHPVDAARLINRAAEGIDMDRRTVSTKTYQCQVCHVALHEHQPGSYAELTHGWVKMREKGANAVTMPEYSGRRLCGACWSGTDPEYGEQLGLGL